MKVVMNEKRKAIIKVLESAKSPMTLQEIADTLGMEKIATGTTNPMIENGYIKKVGVKKVPVITYREVNVYEIGDIKPETEKGE